MRLKLLLVSLLLTGCASYQVIESPAEIQENIGSKPQLNELATVTVGENIYVDYRVWTRKGIKLGNDVQVSLGLGDVIARKGDDLVKAKANNKMAYCTVKNAYVDPMAGPYKPACFIDNNASGFFSHVTAAPGAIWFEEELLSPTSYVNSEFVMPNPNAYLKEIVYSGGNNKKVKISHKEYAEDVNNPISTQEIEFEIDKLPTVISIRNIKIEIIEINNSGMTYKLI